MAWQITRHNQKKNETTIAPGSYTTRAEAFDDAWDNIGTFLKNQLRSGSLGDTDGPPAVDFKYKLYVETRSAPQQFGFHLRYDYPTNNPADPMNTNDITWAVTEV